MCLRSIWGTTKFWLMKSRTKWIERHWCIWIRKTQYWQDVSYFQVDLDSRQIYFVDIDFKLILEFIWRHFLDKASKASSKKELISWTSLKYKISALWKTVMSNEWDKSHTLGENIY